MDLGRAKCWFNNDERQAKELDGWWDQAQYDVLLQLS
jgi:hypothetical protein